MTRKIFLIAGEASGDRHAASLVEELRGLVPEARFEGLGGPLMREAGVSLLEDMTRISALGLGDVLRQYFTYRRIFYRTLAHVRRAAPDLLILIDSPAFNLRLAKKIAGRVPVIYYISPQVWAWGARRIRTIKRTVDKMLVILPFEKPLYEKAGVPCSFVGHPLLDQIRVSAPRERLREGFGILAGETAVGLAPGSRASEVRRILPIMMESAALLRQKMPETVFYLTPSPNVRLEIYETTLRRYPSLGVRAVTERRHDLLHALDFALVASGTATLETALLGTPFFLLYKTGASTYAVGRSLVRVPYLGLVNLLAGKRVVPEFIQNDARPVTISHEAFVLLKNADLYAEMKREFLKLRELLGEKGASARAAREIANFLGVRDVPRETQAIQAART